MTDLRLFAPATQRNRDVILSCLRGVLPPRGLLLEIASGTGEHCAYLAGALPDWDFQPTDRDEASLASIDAWAVASGHANIRPALALNATSPAWPVDVADAVLCVNMIHISPWDATLGLLSGAARVLRAGAPLVVYGPFDRAGVALAPSNAAFDAGLRARDPAWGVRHLDDVTALALAAGFGPPEVIEVPAQNVVVIYRLAAGTP